MKKRVDIHFSIETNDVSDGQLKLAIEDCLIDFVNKLTDSNGGIHIETWRVRVLDSPTYVPRSVTPVPIMEDAIYIIRSRQPDLDPHVEYPGCIVVKLNTRYEAWFGTANETWDASIVDTTENGVFVDNYLELLDTGLSVETRDCVVLGQAIIDAVKKWKEANGK